MKVFPSTPFVFNTGTATFEAERRRLLRMATEGELCGSPHPGRDLPSPFAFSQQFHSAPEIITLRNVTVFSAKNSSARRISLSPWRGLYARLVMPRWRTITFLWTLPSL